MIRHPAKYTDKLLPVFAGMLEDSKMILDPFGGTGKVMELNKWLPDAKIYAVELEPEWANCIRGDALNLPFADNTFDCVLTSCAYGNRLADKLGPPKYALTRNTYASYLGRNLSKNNSGAMQWGQEYKDFHVKAWKESCRVLCPNGLFILNIKDHIRNGNRQFVTSWHIGVLESLGLVMLEHEKVNCPGNRYGDNYQERIEYESVIKFRKI